MLQGEQRVQGLEFGVVGRPLPALSVFTGYTYLDSEILESNEVVIGVSVVGNEMPNAPHHSFSFWTTYDFLEGWQVGTGIFYVGERFANNANTNVVPSHVRWDLSLGYQINKSIQLRLNAINLNDELYFDGVHPALFNRYEAGMSLGTHLDNAVRQIAGTPFRIRTDLAATLFLSQPDEYDGGELVIDDVYGAHAVKLPAGEMVLYPATSLHHVTPVKQGTRLASIFWVQSMIRDDSHRRLLFELDMAINQVNQALPNHAAVVAPTNCYHNLLRRDAEVG